MRSNSFSVFFSFVSLLGLFLAQFGSATLIEGLVKRGYTEEDCGCFGGPLTVTRANGRGSVSIGNIPEVCLCAGQIPNFLSTASSAVTRDAINVGGLVNARTALLQSLNQGTSHQKCTFPPHYTSKCSKSKPCQFECTDGFTAGRDPTTGKDSCICPSPLSVCGGKCQRACPSARSLPEKRSLVYYGKETQKSCTKGWTACGVPGGGPRDWECVDTLRDLESCGGCPIDLLSSESRAGLGVDCTTLPGVADVSCIAGGCAVHKCLKGYKVSRSGQHCEVVGKMIDTVVEIIAEVAEEKNVEPEFVQGTKASEVEVSEVSEVKAHGVGGGYVEEAMRILKVVKAFGMDYVLYRK